MRWWNVGQRSIGPGLHKQWHDSQAWIHTLHLPASLGRWQPVSYPYPDSHCYVYTNTNRYSYPDGYSNAYCYFNAFTYVNAATKPVRGSQLHRHQAESCAVSLEQRWVHDIGHHERSSRPIDDLAELAPGVHRLLLQYDDRRSIASSGHADAYTNSITYLSFVLLSRPVIHDLVINLEDDRETSRFLKELKFKQLFGVYLDGGDKLAVVHVECLDGYLFLSRQRLNTR